jgi:hypothetical protein
MDLLRQGKLLIIFPEDPGQEPNKTTGMRPFMHTFARLGEMVHAETGEQLPFHPVAVLTEKKVVQVAPGGHNKGSRLTGEKAGNLLHFFSQHSKLAL